ncbi:transposase [Caldifermentibacillus hisashii]|uniref:transposase n=1 Tax=Caldifermentibacillus hisashii TaxID=996558 RepID=UPI001FCF829A|nr:transposase [Caldifermentibacillus hisashii]
MHLTLQFSFITRRVSRVEKKVEKRYWGQHLWARGYFCGTVGNVTKEITRNYIANQFTEERTDIFKVEDEF